MRLHKYMAQCGVASRRKCEAMIAEGRVAVNGMAVTGMGTLVQAGDVVTVDGRVIAPEEKQYYILYHKPIGEVSTVTDPRGRPTVLDRFADFPARLYPVGRLDFDSEGLLLLTNDGDLTQRMLHPSREVDKTYLIRVAGDVGMDAVRRLRQGVVLEGRTTAPAEARIIRRTDVETVMLVTIHEGRNRQVRRMLEAVGHAVVMLRRVQFGPLQLGGLGRGQWRMLTPEEVAALKAL